jgi:hypothetical protein
MCDLVIAISYWELKMSNNKNNEFEKNDDFFVSLLKDVANECLKMSRNINDKNNNDFNFIMGRDAYDSDALIKFLSSFSDSFLASENRLGISSMILTGNAGIGKTTFFNSLKYDFANFKKKVIKLCDENYDQDTNNEIESIRALLEDDNNIEMLSFKPDEGGMLIIDFRQLKTEDAYNILTFIDNKINSLTSKQRIDLENYKVDFIINKDENGKANKFDYIISKILKYAKYLFEEKKARFVLIFDNLDLCPESFQNAVFSIYKQIIDKIAEYYENFENLDLKLHSSVFLLLTLRNDTYGYYEKTDYYNNKDIQKSDFPTPKVYLICKKKFELATYKYLENQGIDIFKDGKGNLEIYNPYSYDNEKIIIDNNKILIENITNILFPYEMYSKNVWSNMDKDKKETDESIFTTVDFYEFHNQFVNSDVRRYFLFRMNLLKKYDYVKKLFPFDTGRRHPSNKYDYLATLILGAKIKIENFVDENGWYYNNKHIGYEAYHSEIITFNVFETFDLSRLINKNNSYEKTFLYTYVF